MFFHRLSEVELRPRRAFFGLPAVSLFPWESQRKRHLRRAPSATFRDKSLDCKVVVELGLDRKYS